MLEAHHDFKYVIIALESTGFYGGHIANYLSTCELLAPFSTQVYYINPKEVANYKKSFNAIGKADGIDSFVIADFARVGRISIDPWRGSQYLALQRLTRHRLHITECIAREKTYMLNNIFLKFSEFAMLKTVKGLNPVEYQVLNSIPGIGPVFSAGILAEIGSINVCSITICLYNGTLRNLLPPILISMTSS
ncbi:MAG: transposase [Eubacteriales bacterium]|nr:transposase [Eubacteriales bacterium]